VDEKNVSISSLFALQILVDSRIIIQYGLYLNMVFVEETLVSSKFSLI